MPSKRILIIENDVGFLRAFQDAFTGNDVQIDVVADGKAASQKAKEDLPNVILLSLDLLGNSGYAVYNKLKRHRLTETIPVIILSNASEESFNRQALLNPDQYYLFKPSDLLQIVETTNALIQMGDSPQDASPGAEGPEPIEIAAEEVVEADPQVVETIDAQRHVLLDANEILPPMEDDTTFDEEDEGRPPAQTPSASQIAKKESTRASGSAEIKAEQSSAPPPLPATPLEAVLHAAASATPADTKSLIITIEEEAAVAPHPGNPPTQGEAATEVATEAATEAVTEVATEAATEALDPRTSLSAPVLLTKLHHSQEQIQLLREKVNRLEGKLDERNQAFEKRESDISKLRALTTAHERTMLSLKSTVTAKDRESLEIKEEINQKVQVIIELQEKTDEREKEILQIHEMVSGRDREIKDLSAKYDESLRVKNELQELHETRMSEWEQSHAEATASFEHQRNTLHAEQARAAKEAADRQRTLQGDIHPGGVARRGRKEAPGALRSEKTARGGAPKRIQRTGGVARRGRNEAPGVPGSEEAARARAANPARRVAGGQARARRHRRAARGAQPGAFGRASCPRADPADRRPGLWPGDGSERGLRHDLGQPAADRRAQRRDRTQEGSDREGRLGYRRTPA